MFAQRRSSRGLFVRLAILGCLVALALSYRDAGVAHDDANASDVVLLRFQSPSSDGIVQLDPETLADESTAPETGLDPAIDPWTVIFSRDGQMLVGMAIGQEIIVQEGLGGPIVFRIPTEGAIWPLGLSADGSRLVVTVNLAGGSRKWKTFDTSTGAKTAEFAPKFGEVMFANQQVIDPVAWKLYRLYQDGIELIDQYNSTGAANLIVTDLSTGDEVDRLRLPDVLIGSRLADATTSLDNPVFHDTLPGIAISPDGSEIAVVSATDESIVLVDTKTMTIKQTLTMHEQTGLVDHLFGLLPLAPRTAEAKATEGEGRRVFYAADGDHIYVGGYTAEFNNNVQSYDGHGLSRVDLSEGEIESHVLDGILVYQVVESANGNLYATGVDYRNKQPGNAYGFVVARLEGDADKVLAERTLDDTAVLILDPNASS
jgi:WD40 repeat protein